METSTNDVTIDDNDTDNQSEVIEPARIQLDTEKMIKARRENEYFILQVAGITPAKLLKRPSARLPMESMSDVFVYKDCKPLIAYTPSLGCEGLAEAGSDLYVSHCPDDDYCIIGQYTSYTVFLSHYVENAKNEQIICINPVVAIELMESIIFKGLVSVMPLTKQFKRNIPMILEGKVDSVFSFVGICEDDQPFIMDVNSVSSAEYIHGPLEDSPAEQIRALSDPENRDHNTKTAYFPARGNRDTIGMIKRIRDLITIKKESNTHCMLGYVINRTDVHRFEISAYDYEYRMAVKDAIDNGVDVVPIIIRWTKDGYAFFVTDTIPVVYPQH